ncbi:MAG: hypothetical protein ABFQ65_01095 [Nanoarchaeota archaeon]
MQGLIWLGLILNAILIWVIYRLCKKEPKKDIDKPKEDYIDTKEEQVNQKVEKRKPKKTQIEELLSVRKEREELVKEREKNIPKFEEVDDEVRCIFKEKVFLFDKEGYKFYNDIFRNYGKLTIKNKYLAIDEESNEWVLFFHREFMRIEIEDFCVENNCKGDKVVIHHTDFSTTNNKKENLRVMFKEEHNKLHHR